MPAVGLQRASTGRAAAGGLLAAAAAAALGACDPVWRVQGVVTSGDAPVVGAHVAVRCDTGGTSYLFDTSAETDASGRFSLGKVGPTPNGRCTLTVTKDGYAPATATTERCSSGFGGCRRDVGAVRLVRAPSGDTPSRGTRANDAFSMGWRRGKGSLRGSVHPTDGTHISFASLTPSLSSLAPSLSSLAAFPCFAPCSPARSDATARGRRGLQSAAITALRMSFAMSASLSATAAMVRPFAGNVKAVELKPDRPPSWPIPSP